MNPFLTRSVIVLFPVYYVFFFVNSVIFEICSSFLLHLVKVDLQFYS